jgi:LuxR family maltose regulon positive regulatory protein
MTVAGLTPLIDALAQELDDPGPLPAPPAAEPLSAAELRVLRLLPTNLTYRQIAAELFVSLNTVRTHAGRIRRKLSAPTRDEAVRAARVRGLL